MRTRSMKFAALFAAMVVVVQVGPASPAMAKKKVKPPVTFEASGSFAMSPGAWYFFERGFWNNITGTEFRNTCSIPASQGVDGYVVELSDAISAVTSTVLVSGSDATRRLGARVGAHIAFGHDFDMYFFDADCAPRGASTNDSTGGRPPGTNYGDERGVFRAGTKYVLVVAGGGPGLEFTLYATEKR